MKKPEENGDSDRVSPEFSGMPARLTMTYEIRREINEKVIQSETSNLKFEDRSAIETVKQSISVNPLHRGHGYRLRRFWPIGPFLIGMTDFFQFLSVWIS